MLCVGKFDFNRMCEKLMSLLLVLLLLPESAMNHRLSSNRARLTPDQIKPACCFRLPLSTFETYEKKNKIRFEKNHKIHLHAIYLIVCINCRITKRVTIYMCRLSIRHICLLSNFSIDYIEPRK